MRAEGAGAKAPAPAIIVIRAPQRATAQGAIGTFTTTLGGKCSWADLIRSLNPGAKRRPHQRKKCG